MLGNLFTLLFPEGNQAWARRIAVIGATVMLVSFTYAVFWDRDVAHSSITMTNSIAGLTAVLSVFGALGVADTHLKRNADREDRRFGAPKGVDPDANQ